MTEPHGGIFGRIIVQGKRYMLDVLSQLMILTDRRQKRIVSNVS